MGKRIKEFYISIDGEADGPCPGVNSMIQFGAVFYDAEGTFLEEFCVNIQPIEGGVQDPGTMAWWATQEEKRPGLWKSVTENAIPPLHAMLQFQTLVKKWSGILKATPLIVAYPAGYDFTWLYVYLCKFLGQSCVGFSALDMKTMAMCLLNRNYHDSTKRRFPRSWFDPKLKHTHNALDDAREQGHIFFAMKKVLGDWYTQQEAYFSATQSYPLTHEQM